MAWTPCAPGGTGAGTSPSRNRPVTPPRLPPSPCFFKGKKYLASQMDGRTDRRTEYQPSPPNLHAGATSANGFACCQSNEARAHVQRGGVLLRCTAAGPQTHTHTHTRCSRETRTATRKSTTSLRYPPFPCWPVPFQGASERAKGLLPVQLSVRFDVASPSRFGPSARDGETLFIVRPSICSSVCLSVRLVCHRSSSTSIYIITCSFRAGCTR